MNLISKLTSQVADELVAEFADPCNSLNAPDQVRHENTHENVT